jgi:hypothetical protein
MPLLTSSRAPRRLGGLIAAVGLTGALWGPIEPAEAGASAGSAAKPAHATFKPGRAQVVTVGNLLGSGPAAAGIRTLEPIGAAQRVGTCNPSTYGTSFTTTLGSGWSTLNARSAPCTSASANSTWTGGTFRVTAYTPGGTSICRGGSYGYGSSYWYRTSKGWVWSGGTSDPIWNTNC